jgi:hypothetical protein
MSDEPERLTLLRSIDAKLDHMAEDVADLLVRTNKIEIALGTINRRLDRVDERLERLEGRTGLLEGHEVP